MLVYAVTIFLSAFLLFQIQPIVAKWMLPSFGGSAAVWTTCMVFFQLVLLLGYVYSDWSVRKLGQKRQIGLHLGLLATSVLALFWRPDTIAAGYHAGSPVFHILLLLSVTIGLPYLTLSTTSPLVQFWYARRHETALPYRLFALSNLASIVALLAYPVVIEPYLSIHLQFRTWSWAYAVFVLFCVASAYWSKSAAIPHAAPDAAAVAAPAESSGESEEAAGWDRRFLWTALAACASVLFLGVTNQLTQNVAPVPFLWVLPLSVYLLSFVICFDQPRWVNHNWWRRLILPALLLLGIVLMKGTLGGLGTTVALITVALFLCCMFCHSELARLKPHPRYLTSFYLMVSVGGAAGGVFVGLIAPFIFDGFYELPVGMVFCAILALNVLSDEMSAKRILRLSLAAFAGFFIFSKIFSLLSDTRLMERNFYGSLRIEEIDRAYPKQAIRVLFHGSTVHGAQFIAPAESRFATTYYGPKSGIGVALANIGEAPIRVGVVGLGAGTLATYGRTGDYFRFYEINPLVIQTARTNFSFLRDSKATVTTVLGDGRLALEQEADQHYDLLVLDAFSGDSIPVHLLTREAFALYFRHLNSSGILAVHVSNRYLDLQSVVAREALLYGKQAVTILSQTDPAIRTLQATWCLVTSNRDFLQQPALLAVSQPAHVRPRGAAWTDDYSNLFQVLK